MKEWRPYLPSDGGNNSVAESCHVGDLPVSIEEGLKETPEKIFMQLHGLENALNTYIAWQEGRPIAVLLFEMAGSKVEVINHIAAIDQSLIQRFCEHIFTKFETVDVISMKAVHSEIERHSFPYPIQIYNKTETFLISLPETLDAYENSLGKATRRNIRYYGNKLVRDFPTFSHRAYVDGNIQEEHIRKILRLRESRFEAKKVYYHDSEESIQRVVRLARTCGLVTVMSVDGRICAGTINFRAGPNFVGHVLTQAAEFKDYMLGMISAHRAISEAVRLGGKTFELGSGRFEYKTRLNGARVDMDRLDIYRSPAARWFHIRHFAQACAAGHFRKAKLWLLSREKSLLTRTAISFLYHFLKLRDRRS